MRGLSEHLGLLVLQQRAAEAALESDLLSLTQEVNAIRSLKDGLHGHETLQQEGEESPAVPPQTPLRNALETQTRGLLQSLEALREVQMLVQAVAEADPPSTVSGTMDEQGWGEAPMDARKCSAIRDSLSASERSVVDMLGCLPRYSEAGSAQGNAHVTVPLLSHGILTAILGNQEKIRSLAEEWEKNRDVFACVVPPAALGRVADHISTVVTYVDSALRASPLMGRYIAAAGRTVNPGGSRGPSSEPKMNSTHASRIGTLASEAVKAMLLTVQTLCNPGGRVKESTGDEVDEGAESEEFSTESTLFDAHFSAFEQARGLKLWRCTSLLKSLRFALQHLSEDEELLEGEGWERFAGACDALVCLVVDVAEMAQQVLAAGRAVFIGLVALNKVGG